MWMLSLVAVLLFALYFVAGVMQFAVTRSAAAGAADLAAIAAAARVEAACDVAQMVASQNEAELIGCAVRGDDVEVEVQLPAPPLFRTFTKTPVRATAVAGPSLSGV